MKPEPLDASDAPQAKSDSLGRVLGRSRKIRVAIKQAAGRLTSATAVLRHRNKGQTPTHAVERAITQYEDVENEVVRAARDLSQVTTTYRRRLQSARA